MIIAPHIAEELANPEICAQLRIIAADDKKLTAPDRSLLVLAANELEIAYRQLLVDNQALVEALRHAAALQERIVALAPKVEWSMGATVNGRLTR